MIVTDNRMDMMLVLISYRIKCVQWIGLREKNL